MGGVTKRAPLGGGIEYPVSGWTSLPQTKLIPAGVSKNISPEGALLMAPPPEKGDILCPSHTSPYRPLDCSFAVLQRLNTTKDILLYCIEVMY